MVKHRDREVSVVRDDTPAMIPAAEVQAMIVGALSQAMAPLLKELKEIKASLRHPGAAIQESEWDEHHRNHQLLHPGYAGKARADQG